MTGRIVVPGEYLFDTLVDLLPCGFTYQRDDLPTDFDEYRISVKGYDDRCLRFELALVVAVLRKTHFPSCAGSTTGRDHYFTSMYQGCAAWRDVIVVGGNRFRGPG